MQNKAIQADAFIQNQRIKIKQKGYRYCLYRINIYHIKRTWQYKYTRRYNDCCKL